ncbi:hypothetical protein L7F22_036909 [Adiantum nelumboides]|nr:hypothetical protein [Adiantum nelumboides]
MASQHRCTGYRPIFDACKSFAGDVDVEDLGINSFWASTQEANIELLPPFSEFAEAAVPVFLVEELDLRQSMGNADQHMNGYTAPQLAVDLSVNFRDRDAEGEEKIWIQTSNLDSVFKALHSLQGRSDVRLVVGNTSSGYYKDQRPLVLVDVGRVPELLAIKEVSGVLTLGATVSIEKLIDTLEVSASEEGSRKEDTSISHGLLSHLRKVANPHVRHRASIGGNLIMAQQFHFDSDLTTLFIAVGATLQIVAAGSRSCTLSMEKFLQIGVLEPGWLLESVSIPLRFFGSTDASTNRPKGLSTEMYDAIDYSDPRSKHYQFRSYRASPRNLGNALAHLNAAFIARISSTDAGQKVLDVRLAFGAFGGAHAMRVRRVESFLSGKVADSPEHAKAAADRVEVQYDQECLPVLSIEDAVARKSLFSLSPFMAVGTAGNVEQGFTQADHKILDAEVKTSSQYYFYMETQTALAIPAEDNCIVVYSPCQSPEILQKSLSMCLGLPHHNVRIITRRVGGGFGGKATRNIVVASACAVAAFKLQRTARMYLDRKTDMLMMGGRHPIKTLYSVAFKSDGKVTGLKAKIFIDRGWSED